MSHPTRSDAAASAPAAFQRRTLLAWTGGLIGAGTLGVPTGTAGAFARPADGPISMAMHIHGSFSEGMASMEAHLFQAERVGVDVVWWTDHDFRAAAHGYRTVVGFDSEHEPQGPWDWSWTPLVTGDMEAGHEFVDDPHSPDEDGGALLLSAQSGDADEWSSYTLRAVSANLLYSTSYYDTVLSLDILPQQVGDDAEVVVEVISSYRPASHGRPAGQYRIQYRVGGALAGRHLEEAGLLGVVNVPAGAADAWQRVEVDLQADHRALWPDTNALDASLVALLVGVSARRGAPVAAVVDRLRFARTRRSSGDALRALREAMHTNQARFPAVTQYAASEVSLVKHLNAFGGDRRLPPYDMAYPVKDTTDASQRAAVDFLHEHGAVVSINHPLQDSGGADALASRLVSTNGNGADVIEIGTRSRLSTLESVYDIAAGNGVFLTATGTTDDHVGDDWLTTDPGSARWITSVWSATRRKSDLCDALRAGRAWFHDPLHWRGDFDLVVAGRTRMGGVHFTSRRRVDVDVTATRMGRHSSLELVVGRCDPAGGSVLVPDITRASVAAVRVIGGRWSTGVIVGKGVFVRAMIRSHRGAVIGFSNPVWVLPAAHRSSVRAPGARLRT